VRGKMAKKLAKFFSTSLLIVSAGVFFVYANYLKVNGSHHAVGQFKFAYYGMGSPIYISEQDYFVFLRGVRAGLSSSIIALYYLQERRKN
jgi:hypothetical protein